jgi:hypothetical protein
LRLTSTIIAVVLALSMAIFPVSMVRAAAMVGHSHAGMTFVEHGNPHVHAASPQADCASLASADDHATPSDEGSQNSAPSCCGMAACHVFQMSAAPTVSTPTGSAHVLHSPGDEQVTGAFSVRIDRPPRTV